MWLVCGWHPISGLNFHFHIEGFNEMFYGRKRWFLYSTFALSHKRLSAHVPS